MADGFDVNMNGSDRLDDGLAQLQAKLTDLRPIWPLVATEFHRIMRRQFASEGGYSGDSWTALSPAYAAWKERTHPGLPIGELSGVMKGSLVDPFGNLDSIYEATADTLRIGTRTPYARYFHARRPIIALTEADKEQITKIVRDAFAKEAVELGFKVISR